MTYPCIECSQHTKDPPTTLCGSHTGPHYRTSASNDVEVENWIYSQSKENEETAWRDPRVLTETGRKFKTIRGIQVGLGLDVRRPSGFGRYWRGTREKIEEVTIDWALGRNREAAQSLFNIRVNDYNKAIEWSIIVLQWSSSPFLTTTMQIELHWPESKIVNSSIISLALPDSPFLRQ